MAKLNVMVLHAPTGFGGAERVIINMNKFLNSQMIHLVNCPFINPKHCENNYLNELNKQKIPFVPISLNKRFEFRYISETQKLIKKHNIHIIHSHGYRSDITAVLAGRGKIPIVSTIHGFTGSSTSVKIYEQIQILILNRMALVFPVSVKLSQLLKERGISEIKIHRLSNVVDWRELRHLAENRSINYYPPQTKHKLIYVGRLSHEKGLDVLISACAIIKRNGFTDFSLLIVGDGPMRSHYTKQVKQESLTENIHFLGFKDNATNIISESDILILPSRTEGIPLVLLEAMALRKLVIASKVGGIPEVIEHNINGIMVEPNSPESLSKYLNDLFLNKIDYSLMAQAGRSTVEKKYDPVLWAEKLEKYYLQTSSQFKKR